MEKSGTSNSPLAPQRASHVHGATQALRAGRGSSSLHPQERVLHSLLKRHELVALALLALLAHAAVRRVVLALHRVDLVLVGLLHRGQLLFELLGEGARAAGRRGVHEVEHQQVEEPRLVQVDVVAGVLHPHQPQVRRVPLEHPHHLGLVVPVRRAAEDDQNGDVGA
eukprot:CAMPEP_0118952624 /NCGR_PEP_ID=MMETSP1169-20130426/55197_1 /TAXON_ID=36882 /ORGANISM="Pyramimonas obovata, Strain CCMP722" /LENGTH=166 /DNA_ID=CAMNT_0006899925 /DNA_START=484 /DNA_END=980 /DNA_ORIENTATION=+